MQAWNHLLAGTDGVTAVCDNRPIRKTRARSKSPKGAAC